MIKADNTLRGLTFYNRDYPQLIQEIDQAIEKKTNYFVSTPTTEIIGDTFRDAEMVNILQSASLRIPDSVTLILLAKMLGKKIQKRLTGIDTIFNLGQSTSRTYKIFYLGAKPDVIENAKQRSLEILPAFDVVGVQHGYFGEKDIPDIINKINESKADILLVGLGFPKQEKFIYDHLTDLKVPVKITVGGSFDVISGAIRRAPKWMQNLGLEWAYRLFQQPSRVSRMAMIPVYLVNLLIYELRHRNS